MQRRLWGFSNDVLLTRASQRDHWILRIAQLEQQLASTNAALQRTSCNSSADSDRNASANAVSEADVVNQVTGIDDQTFTPEATIFVTFVNGDEKYRELMINWALHLRELGAYHLVVAFDDEAAKTCRENGIPFVRCASAARVVHNRSAMDRGLHDRGPASHCIKLF